ncbi:MAG: FAD-dependent oxidoreductase [Candidatus Omnitrophota bacterium]|nr:FAD-dependent oxidoreductase [Candidatus Omnitrophota bacterium]
MKQFVIIGNSAAGIAAVEAIRSKDKTAKITIISNEEYPVYCRCMISYYLAGEVKEEKLFYRPKDFYQKNNLELILNKKVSRVDPKKNRVVCEDKTQVGYDALFIATGARPRFPAIPGIKKKGIFGLRTLKDAKEISSLIPVTKSISVLGGGLIGLKAAYALRKRGIEVKVVVKSKQILSQMLDNPAAAFLQKRLEDNGIELLLGQDVTEIIGEGDIQAVKLGSGKVFGCSMVVVGKGVEPNIDLVKEAGIDCKDGIIVNNLLQTNIPNVYAGGDVCASSHALWPIAVEQGRLAGLNMAGEKIIYDGSLGMNSIEFFGLPVISLGIYKTKEGDAAYEELKVCDPKENTYKKLVLKGNILVGVILAGKIKNSGVFLRLIREKIDLSSIKDRLLADDFGCPDILDLVKDKEKVYV